MYISKTSVWNILSKIDYLLSVHKNISNGNRKTFLVVINIKTGGASHLFKEFLSLWLNSFFFLFLESQIIVNFVCFY